MPDSVSPHILSSNTTRSDKSGPVFEVVDRSVSRIPKVDKPAPDHRLRISFPHSLKSHYSIEASRPNKASKKPKNDLPPVLLTRRQDRDRGTGVQI